MNRRMALSLTALSALTACQSAGQMDQRPPTWTAAYQAPWEPLANCIVARSQRPLLTVTPTFSSGSAQVVVSNAAGGVMGTFNIRSLPGGGTEVAYRSVYGGPTTDAGSDAKDIADRCARP